VSQLSATASSSGTAIEVGRRRRASMLLTSTLQGTDTSLERNKVDVGDGNMLTADDTIMVHLPCSIMNFRFSLN
jgi:hypothetical protein